MVRNRRRRRLYASPQQRMWLEVAGQRRLRRLHQQLAARREVLRRWSALLDDVDRDVARRLADLGGDEDGYDTEIDDVNEPARDHYGRSKGSGQGKGRGARRMLADDGPAYRARAWAAREDEDEEDEQDEDMGKPAIETYYDNGTWRSRRQGSSRAFSTGGTKAQQVAKGREAARKDGTEHIIKNRDGTISERNSYGDDPHSSAG
jgi:hypothetical protein